MVYSFRIEQAIRAAAVLHQNQFRRGTAPYPYVTHVFAVSCIVSDYTTDEDSIVASLLHDTLEMTDYTPEELESDFGAHVRDIVLSVSEEREDGNLSWLQRKELLVEKLEKADEPAHVIAAAEAIHNMRSVVEEYQAAKEQYLRDFGENLEDRLVIYQKMSNLFNRNLKNDILHEFNHVYGEYKSFLESLHSS